MSGGQALLELAVCVPLILLLAVGGAAVVQIAEAKTGLDAAAQAAAAAAARAPDPVTARAAASARFASVVRSYPLAGAVLHLDLGAFQRSGSVVATANANVDLGWASLVPMPGRLELEARAVARLESWRTRRAAA